MSTPPEHDHHPKRCTKGESETALPPLPAPIATDDSGGTPPPHPPKLEG